MKARTGVLGASAVVGVAISCCSGELSPSALAAGDPRARVACASELPDEQSQAAPIDLIAGPRRWLASVPFGLTLDDDALVMLDPDSDDVVVLDAQTLAERAVIRVGHHPDRILFLPDGTLAVSCRGSRSVARIDLSLGVVTGWLTTGSEPRGMALSRDGATLYVAAFEAGEVSAFRLEDATLLWTTAVEGGPVVVAADDQARGVWVGTLRADHVIELDPLHGTRVATVDLPPRHRGEITGMVTDIVPLRDGEAAIAYVTARVGGDPDQARASGTYGAPGGGGLVDGAIAVVRHGSDGAQPKLGEILGGTLASALPTGAEDLIVVVPTLRPNVLGAPGAVALSDDRRRLYTLDGVARTVSMRRAAMPDAPIARDPDGKLSYLAAPVGPVSFAQVPFGPELELGRKLFMQMNAKVSTLGISCAGCHPDGLDDGRTWVQSFGPRQTPRLAGRLAETAPYDWLGHAATLRESVVRTIERLAGTGLSDGELDALVAYCLNMEASDAPARGRALTNVEAHGKDVFTRPEVGCAGCHDPARAFSDGLAHDVGTTSLLEHQLFTQQLAEPPSAVEPVRFASIAYDTPSLRDVGRTAPYLHDGSASTLRALLVDQNVHDRMGATSQLPAADIDALVAYLATL